VSRGYETAKSILSSNIHILHALAQALIDKEELSAEEIHRLVTEAGELRHSSNGTEPHPAIDSEAV
jgi:ATP-dependent Zn protease